MVGKRIEKAEKMLRLSTVEKEMHTMHNEKRQDKYYEGNSNK